MSSFSWNSRPVCGGIRVQFGAEYAPQVQHHKEATTILTRGVQPAAFTKQYLATLMAA
jgi:hypothetical protein